MTKRQRSTARTHALRIATCRIAIAGAVVAGGALGMAGQAAAEPDPVLPTPAPGQPVVLDVAAEPAAPPAPPPVGAPPVPEIPNQAYGQGQNPGQFGYIRDLWHAFNTGNPVDALIAPPEGGPAVGAPPGAGPAPKLPPGYSSLTHPESSTPAIERPVEAGPPLPPGFVSLSDPAGMPEAEPAPVPEGVPAPVDAAVPPIIEP